MENSMFEVRTIENADLAPNGNDGGYGHATINLTNVVRGANELQTEGIMSDAEKTAIVTAAADRFIKTFGKNLMQDGALDKFDPKIKATILERLNQNFE